MNKKQKIQDFFSELDEMDKSYTAKEHEFFEAKLNEYLMDDDNNPSEKDSNECRKRPPKEIGEVYFHINNGGLRFSVVDRGYGPTIKVECDHFGHTTNHIEFHTTEKGLSCLSHLFEHAEQMKYSDLYCDPAKPYSMELGSMSLMLEDKKF